MSRTSSKTTTRTKVDKLDNLSIAKDTTVPIGYVVYDLKAMAHHERMHPNHNAAVDALTRAFADRKRIAIKETGITVSKIPSIWMFVADYVEIDGTVYKTPKNDGQRIKI